MGSCRDKNFLIIMLHKVAKTLFLCNLHGVEQLEPKPGPHIQLRWFPSQAGYADAGMLLGPD